MFVDEIKDLLQRQIEYYFSPDNLTKDQYLLGKMDDDFYVPLETIAQVSIFHMH